MTKSSVQAVAAGDPNGLRLWRGHDGRLWGRAGSEVEGHADSETGNEAGNEPRAVRVCRLFPWSEPSQFVSLRDADDEELALVRRPADLDPESRSALEVSLAEAGFVMEVEEILSVEEEIEIRTFKVRTSQGLRTFQTERDEWPRALEGGGLLIRDVAGDLYAVRHPEELDARSHKLLWVFLD